MKIQVLWCVLLIACKSITAQSQSLTVLNGYGSGLYQSGDTVDIWSEAFHGRSYFETWSGDIEMLSDPLDWHARLIMPDHDVTIEAVIKDLPADIIFDNIQIPGVDTLKDVWYAYPEDLEINGVVWLFHGTNGTGKNWFVNTNMFTCVKRLLAAGYATISLDCEEKTYNEDFNSDGIFRWDYTFDSLQNIDLRNVKAIRDTLISRGFLQSTTTHIAYGYSAGGAFATHIATQLQWHSGISHNSAGVPWVAEFGLTPMLYSMTVNDNHPEVGSEGNAQAEANNNELLGRGICSRFLLTPPQPLYPERFNRDSTISLALSTAIFNEMKNNQVINDDNYLLYSGDQLADIISSSPLSWPVIISLTPPQQLSVHDESDETFATHRFNSDLFGSDFRFITELCENTTGIDIEETQSIFIYPNPATDFLFIENGNIPYDIYNLTGQKVLQSKEESLDVSTLPEGLYMIISGNRVERFLKI